MPDPELIDIKPEWVFRGQITLEETVNRKPTTRLSLSLYTKVLGDIMLRKLMNDDNAATVTIRGVPVKIEIRDVESRGVLDDLLHLHGPAEIYIPGKLPPIRKRQAA